MALAAPEEVPVKPPDSPPVNDMGDEAVFMGLPLTKEVGEEVVFMGLLLKSPPAREVGDEAVFMGLLLESPPVRAVGDEVVFMGLLLESPPARDADDEVVFGTQLRSLCLIWLSKDVTKEAVFTGLLLESPPANEIIEVFIMLSLFPYQSVGAGSFERNDMLPCSHRHSAVDGFPTDRPGWNSYSYVSTKGSLPQGYPLR